MRIIVRVRVKEFLIELNLDFLFVNMITRNLDVGRDIVVTRVSRGLGREMDEDRGPLNLQRVNCKRHIFLLV